jgi:hypothetical protein
MIAITRTNHAPSDMMPPTEQPLQTHVAKFDTSDNLQSDLALRDIKTCFRISPQLCQNQIKNDSEIPAGSPEKLRQGEEAQYDQVYKQSRSA